MNPKSVQLQYNINRMDAAGLVAIIHIDDYETRFLEVQLYDRDGALDVSDSTATARFVTQDGYLLNDSVPCTISQNTVTVPIDAAAVQLQACTLKIEISLTKDSKVLTLPFPLFVRVRGSILDDAQVTPESEGTIPDLLKAAQQALDAAKAAIEAASDYENMDNKPQINGVELVGDKSGTDLHLVSSFFMPVKGGEDECTENGILYYAAFADSNGFIICRNYYTQITQFGWTLDGRALWRTRQGETPWQPAGEWTEWAPTGGAGTSDYTQLDNLPSISGQDSAGNTFDRDLLSFMSFDRSDFFLTLIQNGGIMVNIDRKFFHVDRAGYASPYDFNFIPPVYFDAGVYRFKGANQSANFPEALSEIDRTQDYFVIHYADGHRSTNEWSSRRVIGKDTNGKYVEYAQLISTLYPDETQGTTTAAVTNQTQWEKISGSNYLKIKYISFPLTNDDCIENNVLYHTSLFNYDALMIVNYQKYSGYELEIIHQFALVMNGKLVWRSKTTPPGETSTWTAWQEIGGSQIVSGVVNQNGTITFTDSDDNTFTTTGSSVIGPQGPQGIQGATGPQGPKGDTGTTGATGAAGADGFSPTATVSKSGGVATISITDKNGTTTATVSDGSNYVLTAQDKSDIADLVIAQLPTTQGVLYGNAGN